MIRRIDEETVEYICPCGERTDSTKNLNGWGFPKGDVLCPKCAKTKPSRSSEGADGTAVSK